MVAFVFFWARGEGGEEESCVWRVGLSSFSMRAAILHAPT